MDTSDTRARLARSRRLKTALRIGGMAVALAAVIVVAGALTTARRGESPSPAAEATSTTAPAGSADLAAGLQALAAGDTTAAVDLLTKAAAAGNTQARAKLDEIRKPSAPATRAPAPADAYTRATSDLASLLPTSVAGYTGQQVETSTLSAILPLEPDRAGPVGSVSLAVITVFDKGTPAKAQAFVSSSVRAYPRSGATVRVGMLSGRFGTDGSHLAALTLSRGRYAFEVVLTSAKGAPSGLKDWTIRTARAIPATH